MNSPVASPRGAGAGSSASDVRAKRVGCKRARRVARRHGVECGAKSPCSFGLWTCRTRRKGPVTRVRCVDGLKVVRFKYEPQG
jgi:hypothetical protein